MIAIPGHTYAHITSGRVHWVFTANDLPEWNDDAILTLDITAVNPLPKTGDLFAGDPTKPATWIFTTPIPLVPKPQKYLADEILDLTPAEKARLKAIIAGL